MIKLSNTGSGMGALAAALALGLAQTLGAPLYAAPAQAAAPAAAQAAPKALSIEEAVASALAKDPGVISANLDALGAGAKVDSASWKRIPSLSASAGYTRLSELPAADTEFTLPLPDALGGPVSFSLAGPLNVFSFGLNMQYPVFAGFRVKESIALAGLQLQAKGLASETVKRALSFDVRKAYWEAVRATHNRDTLAQNYELMRQNSELATRQLGEGVSTRADQLAAQMRLEQSTEDLNDAKALQKRAFLTLASLTGENLSSLGIFSAPEGAPMPFELSTKPEEARFAAATADEAALVSQALEKRPETRSAELARKIAEHSVELSRAALYPTVALTGNFNYADPNQRATFGGDVFTASWAVGLQVTYDIGGVPAALDDIKAQTYAASKAKSDGDRQRNAVAMDVEACLVNAERTLRDLASTEAMVAQAEENLRVVQGRIAAGSAKEIDLSSSKFDLLRINFAVTNKRIDALIAQADLARATASEDIR